MNSIGIVGLFYVILWNFIGISSWFFQKNKKESKWVAIIVALTTIPPYLLGFFGSE